MAMGEARGEQTLQGEETHHATDKCWRQTGLSSWTRAISPCNRCADAISLRQAPQKTKKRVMDD